MQIFVGELFAFAGVIAFPYERDLVSTGFQMPVDTVIFLTLKKYLAAYQYHNLINVFNGLERYHHDDWGDNCKIGKQNNRRERIQP